MVRIGITSGMRGRFPVMYDSEDYEPILTGTTCKDYKEVVEEAIVWAKAEFGDDWERYCDVDEACLIDAKEESK